jgi:hypothetical protein
MPSGRGWVGQSGRGPEELTATETIFPGTDLRLVLSLNGPS